MKKTGLVLLIAIGFLALMSFVIIQDTPEPWEVPSEYKNMDNPVTVNDNSLKNGMLYYNKYCSSCHGKIGLGDGPKARILKTFPGDFSDEYYQNQTDGEHFYKTKFGRNAMPKYDKKVPDQTIWDMVNYMRTFKK